MSGREEVRRLTDDHAEATADSRTGPVQFEVVDRRRLARGDRILVRPDERVPRDGTIRAVLTADEGGHLDACVVEPAAGGEQTTREPGESVAEGTRVREASVVVEVTGRLLPWWLSGGRVAELLSSGWLSRGRIAVLAAILVLGVAGSGIGQFSSLQDVADGDSDPTVRDSTAPPAVTATPPSPDPDDTPPTADSSPPSEQTQPPPRSTTEPTPPETASPTVSTTGTSAPERPATDDDTTAGTGEGGSGGSSVPPSSPEPDPSLSITSVDPPLYKSADGTVGRINGSVDGTLQWGVSGVDGVVLVVQVWVPGKGWAETTRAAVAGDAGGSSTSPVDVRSVLGDSVPYANSSRSSPFENPTADTVKRTDGRVAVTAVLYDGDREVGRVTATDAFTVSVEHAEFDLRLAPGSPNATVSLLSAENVVPGQRWINRGTLTNDGTVSGTVSLTNVTYTSYENGLTDPEAEVDASGGDPGSGAGELQSALDARIEVVFENGSRRYVFGDAETYRPFEQLRAQRIRIAALDPGQTVTVEIEYRVRPEAGNEIQSDSLAVDFGFTMVEVR